MPDVASAVGNVEPRPDRAKAPIHRIRYWPPPATTLRSNPGGGSGWSRPTRYRSRRSIRTRSRAASFPAAMSRSASVSELPENETALLNRDAHSGYVAMPRAASAAGKALVAAGAPGTGIPCTTCHGPQLTVTQHAAAVSGPVSRLSARQLWLRAVIVTAQWLGPCRSWHPDSARIRCWRSRPTWHRCRKVAATRASSLRHRSSWSRHTVPTGCATVPTLCAT